MKLGKNILLALTWNNSQLMYFVAESRYGRFGCLSADTIQLEGSTDLEAAGQRLREVIRELGIKRRVQLLVGLSRSQVEMCDLVLPLADKLELAAMVRNEVTRQSSEIMGECLIDFVARERDGQSKITAAVVPAELNRSIQQLCDAARLMPTCVVLRSFALASLFGRITHDKYDKYVLIGLLDGSADISIVSDGRLSFSRTAFLGSEGASRGWLAGQLSGEIQRSLTVASANSQDSIEHIYLLGNAQQHRDTAKQLFETLGITVSVADPFYQIDVMRGQERPSDEFAAHVGMIHDHVSGNPEIDFWAARQPLSTKRPIGRWLGYAAAAVLGFFLAYGSLTHATTELRSENKDLTVKLSNTEKLLRKVQQRQLRVRVVRDWQAGDINWLDELRDFSDRFPREQDAVVQQMSLNSDSNGGTVRLKVKMREPTIVAKMEEGLRDKFHRIRSDRVAQRPEDNTYGWRFDTRLLVRPRSPMQYRGEELVEEVVNRTEKHLRASRKERPAP